MIQLTENQYTILNKQRECFETLVNHGFVSNLNSKWLKELKEVYKELFLNPLNITCSACISQGLTRLYPLIQDYERTNTSTATGNTK